MDQHAQPDPAALAESFPTDPAGLPEATRPVHELLDKAYAYAIREDYDSAALGVYSKVPIAEPRFVPLATVPLGDGARAAAVLRAAMTTGFPGAMIGTLPRGVGSTLDAAELDAFWAAADETGALVHIHPSFDAGDVRVNDFGLANGLGLGNQLRVEG